MSKGLLAILGMKPAKHGPDDDGDVPEESDEKERDDDSEDFEAMASEILDAIESKDSKALAEALRSFVESC